MTYIINLIFLLNKEHDEGCWVRSGGFIEQCVFCPQVDWNITVRGVACQIVLALIVLRWSAGATALEWLADKIVGFLNYAQAGAKFVFGDLNYMHPFAMEVAPILCYFTAVINLLLYWGVMQIIIKVLGSIFEFFIGTSKVEAFIAIAAVFLGPVSELHFI